MDSLSLCEDCGFELHDPHYVKCTVCGVTVCEECSVATFSQGSVCQICFDELIYESFKNRPL